MLFIALLVLWFVILKIFERNELHFFYFITGSVGLFSMLLYLGNGPAQVQLISLISSLIQQLAPYLGYFDVFPQYGMINVHHGDACVSFFIDDECSGFVEMLVFISLAWFYPIYSPMSRLLLSFLGAAYIILANVIRILMICGCIYLYGVDSLFVAHAVLGRLLFFVLVLLLYFNVFTKPHILYQKVGDMRING